MTAQLSENDAGLLVIVQGRRPDRFFNAEQQQPLAELIERWRTARDHGETLPPGEQSELNTLVETELRGFAECAVTISDTPRDESTL